MATPDSPAPRLMLVTGEASGDLHASNLVRALHEQSPGLECFGVGGRRMEEAGCRILIRGEELAVMGLVEVLGHLPVILRAFHRLKQLLQGPQRPDLLILIDFPEFNLRLAKVARAAGVPVLYYVSPQVWAWRQGRVKKIARVVDHLAAIFPFEPEFYRGQPLAVSYVGNPLADEAHVAVEREPLLRELGLDPDRPVVGLFPGSRRNELRYMFATIAGAARLLRERRPELQFLLPVAPSLAPAQVQELLREHDLAATLAEGSIYDIANACDAVITVSGTVTLQTALIGTPMAILYQMSPLSYAIGRRLIRVPHIGLANIVAGEGVVREFIQDEATPQALADEILRLLEEDNYRARVRTGLRKVRERIGPPGCSRRVADIALSMLKAKDA